MIPLLSPEALRSLSTVPAIQRARGWRLYTSEGKRILDMYADGGRMALGRRKGESGKAAKESIDRGLLSAFPTFWEKRLEKQILAWMPDYAGLLFFASEAEAFLALAAMDDGFAGDMRGGQGFPEALSAFARKVPVKGPFDEYRKSMEQTQGYPALGGSYALAMLPLAPAWAFGVVLAKTSGDRQALSSRLGATSLGAPSWGATSSAAVPTVKFAAAARSLADFTAYAKEAGEKRWAAIDPCIAGLFTRSGPWLYPSYPKADHGRVFEACLEKGILISPDYDHPSFVPGEFDSGEVAPLRSVLSLKT